MRRRATTAAEAAQSMPGGASVLSGGFLAAAIAVLCGRRKPSEASLVQAAA